MRLNHLFASAVAIAMACSAASHAAFDLQITEIWSGQLGDDITSDWIEVTNYGDMAWTSGVDANLFVEDESGDNGISTAVLVGGLGAINPGQSVVILFEADAADAAVFNPAWGISGVSVGYADGSGIGLGGADFAYLFIEDQIEPLDFASYPNVSGSPTQTESWDVVLDAWSTVGNASGAFASATLGGEELSPMAAIGSPGRVPEPSTVIIAGLAVVGLAAVRKRIA